MDRTEILDRTRKCDITYHILGETDRSAMPIGNGELAASVWVNKKEEICFYLSRTDALTEVDRTVKLGLFVVRISPGQFSEGSFSQKLFLADGFIRVKGKSGQVDLWIDSDTDMLCMRGTFEENIKAEVEYINWRTQDKVPEAEFWTNSKVYESADIIETQGNETVFYHKNENSIVKETAHLQELEDCMDEISDVIKGRIFGGIMKLEQSEQSFSLRIATASAQTDKKNFIQRLQEMLDKHKNLDRSFENNKVHWNRYWCQSYIFVENDKPKTNPCQEELKEYCKEPREYECDMHSQITRSYLLTKYMNACCNTGTFPVLYNGLLFNLCSGGQKHFLKENFGIAFTEQPGKITNEHNPDERSWCTEQLWQNIRHPYFSLLERGEGRKLQILFRYYRRFWEINRIRAQRYYGASGQHNTEMTLSCGLPSPAIYGVDRRNRSLGYVENRWGGAVDISPGLELAGLMLDYYEFYKEEDFLRENLVYIKELFTYIETRFPEMAEGKMKIGPINSVETYRETINPVPIIAGMKNVVDRILKIGQSLVQDIEYYKEYKDKIPELPWEAKTEKILLPAEVFSQNRYNVEVPEFYAIYPFREYTFYKEELEMAKHTYFLRSEQYGIRRCFVVGETPDSPSYSGWQNLGVVAAVLGMSSEAGEILTNNCSLQNPGTRFPAMWGPIYDAVPDTDHGANILNQLQKMVMQTEDGKIYIAPALPSEWCVDFRLYADENTCVEAAYSNGRIHKLTVVPEERIKDIVICGQV